VSQRARARLRELLASEEAAPEKFACEVSRPEPAVGG
jgi:hypothetical protein